MPLTRPGTSHGVVLPFDASSTKAASHPGGTASRLPAHQVLPLFTPYTPPWTRPALFHAGCALGVSPFRAFPSRTAAHLSMPLPSCRFFQLNQHPVPAVGQAQPIKATSPRQRVYRASGVRGYLRQRINCSRSEPGVQVVAGDPFKEAVFRAFLRPRIRFHKSLIR